MTDLSPPFDALWFRSIVGLAVGLALGSFITMLSYRLPRRISIVKPSSSFCPSCKTPLTARDLVPVMSWVAYSGKCRSCGAKIGARYPLIELATAIATMAAFGYIGFQPMLAAVLIGIVGIVTLMTILLEKV